MGTDNPNLCVVHAPVKGFVSRERNERLAAENEAIRTRLAGRLAELGREGDYQWLADRTAEPRGQVWKWATGDTAVFPATFAAALERAEIVNARYLLTGVGSPVVVEPDDAAARLRVAGKVIEGRMGEALIELIPTLRPALPEDLADELVAALGGGSRKVGPG